MHRINRRAPVRQNTATPRASRGQQCAPRLTLFPFTHAQGQPRAREGTELQNEEEVASWKEGDWSTAKLRGGPLSPAELSETKEEFWARRMGEYTELEKSEAATTSPKGRPPIKGANPTTDEVAARLGYSTAFFSYITGGREVDLKQLAQAELRNDSGSRQPSGPLDRNRALRPMPQPAPPAEARTVTPPFQGDPMDGIPEKFRGTFDFYIMFKDGAAVKRRVEQWERSFISDSLACRKDVAEGRSPKSRFRQVLHITPEEFDDFIKGRHVNCSDPEACFIVSAADQLPPPGVGIDYDAVSADVGGPLHRRAALYRFQKALVRPVDRPG